MWWIFSISLAIYIISIGYSGWSKHLMATGKTKLGMSYESFTHALQDFKKQPAYQQLLRRNRRIMRWLMVVLFLAILGLLVFGPATVDYSQWFIWLASAVIVVTWFVMLNLAIQELRLMAKQSFRIRPPRWVTWLARLAQGGMLLSFLTMMLSLIQLIPTFFGW